MSGITRNAALLFTILSVFIFHGCVSLAESENQREETPKKEPKAKPQTSEVMWVKEILRTTGQGVAIDSRNNVIVGGFSQKGVLVKYAPDGNGIWSNSIDWQETFGVAIGVFGRGLKVDSKDNILVSGCTGSGKDTSRAKDSFIIKYDKDGKQIWKRRHDSGASEFVQRLAIDSKDNVIIVGSTGVGNLKPSIGDQLLVVKYEADGKLLWEKKYTDYDGRAKGVAVDSYDNIVVSGTLLTNKGSDCYAIKYGPDGNVIWSKRRDFNVQDDATAGVAIDSRDNIYISGVSTDANWKYPSSLGKSLFVIKYASDGNEVWNKVYDLGDVDWPQGMAIDKSDNVIIATAISDTGKIDNLAYVVLKYDSQGNPLKEYVYGWEDRRGGTYEVDVDGFGNIITTGTCLDAKTKIHSMVTVKFK